MNVLILDNYDSFTFNLYQYIGEILQESGEPFTVTVKRNDEVSLDDVKSLKPDCIIISPGPGSPDDPSYFGVCGEVITELGKTIPTLGVCLGMQGIAYLFGGEVIKADVPMHGKTSPIAHDNAGVFLGLPQGLEIMRYHSLIVQNLPECLEVTAVVTDTDSDADFNEVIAENDYTANEIMGLRHTDYPIEGVQFHPESFATEGAKRLLANFLLNPNHH